MLDSCCCQHEHVLTNSAPYSQIEIGEAELFIRRFLVSARICCLALSLGMISGCAMWDVQKWNPENLRDPRARDIDERLSKDVPIGQNPFGAAGN
jgi:hypothetical protein